MKTRQLVFFTNTFPYGTGEQWKSAEIEAFKKASWDVHVVPLRGSGTLQSHAVVDDVTYHPPLLGRRSTGIEAIQIASPRLVGELRDALASPLPVAAVRQCLRSAIDQRHIAAAASDLRLPSSTDRVLYFFWGRGAAEGLRELRSILQARACVVRLHRFDLYEQYSPAGYLPFRKDVWSADRILSVSKHGADHLRRCDPKIAKKVMVRRLGTSPSPCRPQPSTDGIFRVVSCSSLTPVKRVHEIPALLEGLESPQVHWTHFGDGPMRDDVMRAARARRIDVSLEGHVPPPMVRRALATTPYDLFVNVSESEGVPVSIMEALAAGIPVVATDVGGTSEVVDDTVGAVVNPQLDATEFAECVKAILSVDSTILSKRCRARHSELCDGTALADSLVAEVFNPLLDQPLR